MLVIGSLPQWNDISLGTLLLTSGRVNKESMIDFLLRAETPITAIPNSPPVFKERFSNMGPLAIFTGL